MSDDWDSTDRGEGAPSPGDASADGSGDTRPLAGPSGVRFPHAPSPHSDPGKVLGFANRLDPQALLEFTQRHPKPDGGDAFIQWKGTDVCMDVFLPCGCTPHIDGDGGWFVRCDCGRVWQLGTRVEVTPVPEDQAAQIDPVLIREEALR